jgi:hypothetical protein
MTKISISLNEHELKALLSKHKAVRMTKEYVVEIKLDPMPIARLLAVVGEAHYEVTKQKLGMAAMKTIMGMGKEKE